jgi:two-component system response regulator HydG
MNDSSSPDRTEPPLVLVVDDDPMTLFIVASFLDNEGYRVETVGTVQEALAYLLEKRPALVLLDMELPDGHGSDLVKMLGEHGISVPIVVMTAARDARDWAEKVGAAAYVSKPLSLPLLLRRIDDVSGLSP